MVNVTINEFYREIFGDSGSQLDYILENNGSGNLGHFIVFDTRKFYFSGAKSLR